MIASPWPGIGVAKPGAAMHPFFGVKFSVVDPHSTLPAEKDKESGNTLGVLCIDAPWPGIARTILGDHHRYMQTYLLPFPGKYFTGDGAKLDDQNHLWITGRVDDVINKAGHRLGTAEIESALVVCSFLFLLFGRSP